MSRLLAALLAAASCTSAAQAQTPMAGEAEAPLSLSRALELAGASAPSIEVAAADVRAAEAGRSVAGLRPNPTVNVEAENVVGTGPYAGVRSMEATTSLALPLELGGKRSARVAVASSQQDRAIIERAIAEAELRFAVTRAYADAVASDKRLANAREQLRITNEGLRAADVRVRAGRPIPYAAGLAPSKPPSEPWAGDRAQRHTA